MPDPPTSEPNAAELRRRRLAKLEEQQAKAADFEARKAAWLASKGGGAGAASEKPAPKPAPPPPPAPEPAPPPKARAPPPPLPPAHVVESVHVARCLGIALAEGRATAEMLFLPEMLDGLTAPMEVDGEEGEGGEVARPKYVISATEHVDEVMMYRINGEERPLVYLLAVYQRTLEETALVGGNRRFGEDLKARVKGAIAMVSRAALLYTGMVLNGVFGEEMAATPAALVTIMLHEESGLPPGFIKALLDRYAEDDAPGEDDLRPVFSGVFAAIRQQAASNMKLSSSKFVGPLKVLTNLLHADRRLCVWLTEEPMFAPSDDTMPAGIQLQIRMYTQMSYLSPFFGISPLPGLPLHAPNMGAPEDMEIGRSYFQNPSMSSQTDVEGAIHSLRSSLAVVRGFLHQIGKVLVKAGDAPREATLGWFSKILNLNKKRLATQVDYTDASGDGFMMNIMYVLLKLAEPVVQGGWKMLEKIDPTFPQSSHRIDYSDETRLAADSDMLKRWWVDKRNKNAQESLTRALEHAEKEAAAAAAASASAAGASSSSDGAGSSAQDDEGEESATQAPAVSTDFKFVTEIYFVTLRAIQLGFMPMVSLYSETLLRSLGRMRGMIKDLEEIPARTPEQEREMLIMKHRFDALLQAKFCYDVFMKDEELLTCLVRFSSGSAEWVVKKLLTQSSRPSLLPLKMPPPAVFASLPEHVVESMSTVLITTMNHVPHIIDRNSDALEPVLTFAIAAASSPLHVKNPYLRAKLVEFISMIFPRPNVISNQGEADDDQAVVTDGYENPDMEVLFLGHTLSCQHLPSAVFRLYVDVEHTGSHTQFYDKFSIRYQIGAIIEAAWDMPAYRKSIRADALDEKRFVQFVNMLLNDANHLLDEALDALEEIHKLETLINSNAPEWTALSDEEKQEKTEHLGQLHNQARSYNQLSNNTVKLLWLLTSDDVVRKVFLRPELVSRVAEMFNYLLQRLCGNRCRDLKVTDAERVEWKPRLLLSRVLKTYLHFHGNKVFATAMSRDARAYSAELLSRAASIAERRMILNPKGVQEFREIAQLAAQAVQEDEEDEVALGDVPDEFLDPIMSTLMENPVRLPTSGNVMDRDVISRILLSDKNDPFNRSFLSEDMLVEEVELKAKINAWKTSRREQARAARASK